MKCPNTVTKIKFLLLLLSITITTFPIHARAAGGLYVPVSTGLEESIGAVELGINSVDTKMGDLINTFKDTTFTSTSTSLRALLSLNPGPEIAAELYNPGKRPYQNGGKSVAPATQCQMRKITNPDNASPDEGGAWQQLINDGLIADDGNYEGTQVNNSNSLSCLLQEIVEQNKLSANLQIHQMLNEYIQRAQTQAVAQREKGLIMAANRNFVNNGTIIIQKDDSGNVVSQKSFPLTANKDDYNREIYANNERRYTDAALGVGPTASFNTPYGTQVAQAMKMASRSYQDNSFDALSKALTPTAGTQGSCFPSVAQMIKFMRGDSDAVYTCSYIDALKEASLPGNNPLGATQLAVNGLEDRYEEIAQETEADMAQGGGMRSPATCDPSDFYCANPIPSDKITAKIASDVIANDINSQTAAYDSVQNEGDLKRIETASENTPQGLSGGTQGQQSPVSSEGAGKSIENFYDSIRYGYFDLQGGTVDWALGAMLQIYDNVITSNKTISPDAQAVDTSAATNATSTP